MAAYAAIVTLHQQTSHVLKRCDVFLYPHSRKTLEFIGRELKSFLIFVERLDSRSRWRMSHSLQLIVDSIAEYIQVFLYEGNSVDDVCHEYEICSGIHSLVEQLKIVKELYHSLPEDEEGVVSKSKMVGLYDERRRLKDDLIVPNTDVESIVYSIVGMAGIGKTALAREIFEDLDISEWYNCRVWVTAGIEWTEGNEWKSEEITKAILAQVDPEVHKILMGGSTKEISERLKECLKGKRYLIVLDDVWYTEINEYLQSTFPDYQNGSRVLLTTRMKGLGIYASTGNVTDMRLLNKEESWLLLLEKVFAGGSCPPHLLDDGKKIAEKCDGLPLTIVTIADLLSKAPQSLWIDVAVKKKHQLFIDAYDQISQVLYHNYEILRDNIQVCLLYMGAFPLKYEIPKSRLINLWLAEKFIEPFTVGTETCKTLEHSAEEWLEVYALSSLVMVYQRDVTSSTSTFSPCVKTCGLHAIWWHFCQTKAREKKLFHVLDSYNGDNIEEVIEGHSRLSIHNNVLFALKHVYNSIEEICASTARSLLCFGPYCQYMVPVCFGLKFLRRLDALNIRFYDFPLEVLKLVKLIYLALTCNRNLPPSISNLSKLKYLIVHPHLSIKSSGTMFILPKEIWDMKELKHLQVMGYDLPDLDDTSLQKLITLSNVTLVSCIILKRVPNLRKLGIEIELSPDAVELLCCFDHISRLTKLESLKCVIVNPEYNLEVVSPISSFPCFSLSLKKLSLSGIGYPWKEMSKIASLPNLKVLKLRCNAFQGPEWEVEENGFPNLVSLLIEDIDLANLKWAHGSFKSLVVLRMKHCYKFVYLHFGDLPNIKEIEAVDCSPFVEWHAKLSALEDVDVFNLFVHSSWKGRMIC